MSFRPRKDIPHATERSQPPSAALATEIAFAVTTEGRRENAHHAKRLGSGRRVHSAQ
jgi:hypothetical protein